MSFLKSRKSFVSLLILLSLTIGSFWVFYFWSKPLAGDDTEYYHIAVSLCEYKQFAIRFPNEVPLKVMPTMSRPPLYPFLISIFYCLFGDNPNAVRIFQIFLFAGIVILIYLIAEQIFNKRTAQLSSILTVLFPPLGILVGQLFSEIPYIFLFLLATLFLIYFFKEKKSLFAFLAGVFFGLATLTRAIPLYLPLFLIIFIFLYNKFKINELLKKSFILLFVFYLVICPWVIRNYLIFKQPSITDTAGVLFYNRAYRINYSPTEAKYFTSVSLLGDYLTKKIYPDYNYSFSKFEPHWERRAELGFKDEGVIWRSPADADDGRDLLLAEAKVVILDHPIKYIGYSFLEFFRLHTPLIKEVGIASLFAGTHPEIPDLYKTLIIVSIRFIYLLFFIVVLQAIIVGIRKFSLSWSIFIVLVYSVLVLCSLDTVPRYSIPLYPFYFIFFAFGIVNLFNKIFKKEI